MKTECLSLGVGHGAIHELSRGVRQGPRSADANASIGPKEEQDLVLGDGDLVQRRTVKHREVEVGRVAIHEQGVADG